MGCFFFLFRSEFSIQFARQSRTCVFDVNGRKKCRVIDVEMDKRNVFLGFLLFDLYYLRSIAFPPVNDLSMGAQFSSAALDDATVTLIKRKTRMKSSEITDWFNELKVSNRRMGKKRKLEHFFYYAFN